MEIKKVQMGIFHKSWCCFQGIWSVMVTKSWDSKIGKDWVKESVFGVILVHIFPYSDQNNSVYGHFSSSEKTPVKFRVTRRIMIIPWHKDYMTLKKRYNFLSARNLITKFGKKNDYKEAPIKFKYNLKPAVDVIIIKSSDFKKFF